MSLSDDDKHELRMQIGSGAMALSDLTTEDAFLDDAAVIVEAVGRLVATMRAHDMPTGTIAGMLTGLALQPLTRELDQ